MAYTPPADMRKSFDGLSALVRQQLAEHPTNGQALGRKSEERLIEHPAPQLDLPMPFISTFSIR